MEANRNYDHSVQVSTFGNTQDNFRHNKFKKYSKQVFEAVRFVGILALVIYGFSNFTCKESITVNNYTYTHNSSGI